MLPEGIRRRRSFELLVLSCGAASRDLFLNRFVVLLISQKDYEHFMLRVSFCISILVYAYILMYCFKHHGFCAVVRRPKNPKHKTQLVVPEAIRRRRGFELLVLSCGAASRDLFLNRFVVLLISQKDYEHFMLRVSFCISILVYAYILMYCFKHHGFCAVVRRPKNPKHKTQLVLAEGGRRRRSFELLVLSFELVV